MDLVQRYKRSVALPCSIVLLSGGLDSLVVLAKASQEGDLCIAISFNYGQRHLVELEYAKKIAAYYKAPHHIVQIPSQSFSSSALVSDKELPSKRTLEEIQNTKQTSSSYVPARNTIFLAFALSYAEHFSADKILIGANKSDLNGYPDCRPAFYEAFQRVAFVATAQAAEGHAPKIETPLLFLTKKEIVSLARKLKAPIEMSSSCYNPSLEGKACNACDACVIRNNVLK